MLGYHIRQLADKQDITDAELSQTLGYTEQQVKALMQGRVLPTFERLSKLANLFNVSVLDLIQDDEKQYNKYMTDCVGQFSDNKNRETILDIIDDYLDVVDAISASIS